MKKNKRAGKFRQARRLKVLALVPEGNIPPRNLDVLNDKEYIEVRMEFDVLAALKRLGHDVVILDITGDLEKIRSNILAWEPDIAFNMLEDFHGISTYDQHLVSYLELMKLPYTGCNPRGLMLARDKALSKKIMAHEGVPTPEFAIFSEGRPVKRPRRLNFPLMVKSSMEESSAGISQASIVRTDTQLERRVRFVHKTIGTDALVEQYIDGREFYVGIIGNDRVRNFPVWELMLDNLPRGIARIASAKVKFNITYQQRYSIKSRGARELSGDLRRRIVQISKDAYRALGLTGYARMDIRLDKGGNAFILEANPNPDITSDEDFALAAKASGLSYTRLIQRILNLGMTYPAPWKA
jgi:D-alanine-D-alanine ligase